MLHKLIRALWGDLEGASLKKLSLLGLGFFFLIGSWWPLKTLKDGIFINMVGPMHLPQVKIASLILFFPLVLGYSRLVDYVSKEKLFYMLISFYGCLGLFFVYLLNHPTIGLANNQTDPSRILGWAFYLFCESYISLMVTHYWSFINDITTTDEAKNGYGLIIFGTQFGGTVFTILGSALSYDVERYTQRAPLIALISVIMFFMVGLVVFVLQHVVNKSSMLGYEAEMGITPTQEETVGFFDGLMLLLTRPYVAGIFALVFFQDLVSTMMGFQLSLLVASTYPDPGMVNKFLFNFAFYVQTISCSFALVGTSFFQRHFGIVFSLVAYPVLIGVSIVCYMVNPTLNTIFYVMLVAKALGFALNQPSKEALYIPTSKSVKYKSKAWIDMFGLRFAKASGSFVNQFLGPLVVATGTVSLAIIGIWSATATLLGNRFKQTVADKKLIE